MMNRSCVYTFRGNNIQHSTLYEYIVRGKEKTIKQDTRYVHCDVGSGFDKLRDLNSS